MAIFGFVILFLILLVATLVLGVATLYLGSKYNIGGVPHTWKDRWFLVCYWSVLIFAWNALLSSAPFSIQLITTG
jgi:hypothetical protein